MEELLYSQKSVPVILASICVMITLHLLVKLGEFVWDLAKKKSELSEKSIEKLTAAMDTNTRAVETLNLRISEVEKDLGEVNKLKQDLRRFYSAIKILAGDKWAAIRKEIMEEEL